jgi:predicted regulator of Ras-like GTPase activity (Roadblock/LC7/MglB family)
MSESLLQAIMPLTRIPGVRGALVVEPDVGIPVVQELAAGVNGMAIAALVSSLYRRAARAASAGGVGQLSTLQLELGEGHVLAAGGVGMLVIVIADASAQLGLVRLETNRAAEAIA